MIARGLGGHVSKCRRQSVGHRMVGSLPKLRRPSNLDSVVRGCGKHSRSAVCPKRAGPSNSVTINDESGNSCTTPAAHQQDWRRHFSSVLNVQRGFNEDEIGASEQRPMRAHLERKPSKKELK